MVRDIQRSAVYSWLGRSGFASDRHAFTVLQARNLTDGQTLDLDRKSAAAHCNRPPVIRPRGHLEVTVLELTLVLR